MTDDEQPAEEKPKRRRRQTATVSSSRLEKRAGKVKETIVEATRWRLRGDDETLGFVETVKRDADRIGHAVAAIGERVKPFGRMIDLLFGEAGPLSILVALAPSIRAGRRAVVEQAKTRRQRNEQARAEQEQQVEFDENGEQVFSVYREGAEL